MEAAPNLKNNNASEGYDCSNCLWDYVCCSNFGVTLSREELSSGFFDKRNIKIVPLTENSVILGYVATLRKKENGFCVYQDDKTKLCTIYKNRPSACRNFDCLTRMKPYAK
jgi:Fe-S-cluster containining protein